MSARTVNWRGRTVANWKFRVAKKMLQRAQKFERRARTYEEMEVWREVQKWFEDILSHRHMTPSGSIGLHYSPDRDDREREVAQGLP